MSTIPTTEVRPDHDGIDEAIAAPARRTVAHYALNAGDCAELLDMLGLRDDPACLECGGPMRTHSTGGYKHGRGGDGKCRGCRRKERDDQQAAAALEKPPAVRCACGNIATTGDMCRRCSQYVPLEQLRLLIERIKRDTAMSTHAIAGRIGVNPHTLAPGNRSRRVRRSTYAAVLRLAEELSA